MDRMEDQLNSLWTEYKEACPDPEPGANFMPQLWQRIENRRITASSLLLRRWTEVCVAATLAFTLIIGAVLIPRYQRQPVYQSTYVDVLADSIDYTSLLTVDDNR